MTKAHTWLIALLIGCVGQLSGQPRHHKAVPDFSPLSRQIQQWVTKGYYPGASMLIVNDGRVVYEQYFGNYTPNTQIYIASAGKWLAVAAIAALVDAGQLSWDDKVVKWLPDWTDAKGQATLRQLLSHTAGYPDYQPKGQHPDNYQTLAEAVAHIKPLPIDTLPGVQFHYGGLAMQVAGRIAELASGKDWETLFQETIARPLGMTGTSFTPVDPTGGHNPMIGGGARSTLHDYAHFLDMISHDGLYHGKRILSENVIRDMQTDQVGMAATGMEQYIRKTRRNEHNGIYGLGEWREEVDTKGMATLITSPSWAGAYPWIDKYYGAGRLATYGFFLTHVDVMVAGNDKFNAFYTSPILPMLVRDILNK